MIMRQKQQIESLHFRRMKGRNHRRRRAANASDNRSSRFEPTNIRRKYGCPGSMKYYNALCHRRRSRRRRQEASDKIKKEHADVDPGTNTLTVFTSLLIEDLLGLLVYAAFPLMMIAAVTVRALFAMMKRIGTRPLLGMITSLMLEAVVAGSDLDSDNDAQITDIMPSQWLYLFLSIAVVGLIILMSTNGSNGSARMDEACNEQDLDVEHGSVNQSGKVFRCSQCDWTSTYTHIESVRRDYTPKIKTLWNVVLKQPKEEDYCLVTCPNCNENLLQCNHCEVNVKETGDPRAAKQRRTSRGYMNNHVNHFCANAANAASKASESISESLPNFTFDSGNDSNDDIHESQGEQTSSRTSCFNEDHSDGVDQYQQDYHKDHLEHADQCKPDETMLIKNINDQHMAEEEDQASEYLQGLLKSRYRHGEYVPKEKIAIPDSSNCECSYKDFSSFDGREEDEKFVKNRRGDMQEVLCQNQLYFYQRYKHQLDNPGDGTGGFAGLVYRADKGNREDPSKSAPPNEAKQMFRLLRMLLKVSGKLRKQLIELQNGFMDLFGVRRIAHNVQTRFPVDMNDVRTIMLEGANSILKNFPSPKVETKHKHACVSLKETIRLAAGHGAKFNFGYDPLGSLSKHNDDGLNGTKAYAELTREISSAMQNANIDKEVILKTRIGWVYLWSDSFLRCFVKQKENSVWVLTATVCPFENVKSTGANTYVLAIGKSGDDHTEIINMYIKECAELMAGFDCYFGDINEIGRMAVGMITYHADRPERQMGMRTMKEGTFGKISGWAVDVSGEFEKKFPACNRCFRKRVLEMIGGAETDSDPSETDSESPVDHCSECFNWKLDEEDASQKISSPPAGWPSSPLDEDFLKEESLDGPPAGREPGQDKLGPVRLTTNFMKSSLSLAYHSLRTGRWTKNQFTAYLRSCNISGITAGDVEQKAYDDREQERCTDPDGFIPQIWSLLECFDRFRFPDLPMHALAHGIVPDVMDIVHSILIHYKKYTAFINFANPILEEITSFRLDYCKIKSLPKAVWVGENSMAYMRLLSYLYGMFLSNNSLSSTETDETREVVMNLKCLLNALQALMSILMSRDQPEKDDVDSHMKLFMSSAHFLHKRFGSLTNKLKSKTLVQKLAKEDLEKLLDEFDIRLNPGETLGNLQKAVAKIKAPQWKDKCDKMGLDKKGKKEELVERVITRVIGNERVESIGDEREADETSGDVASTNDEKKCWNKGNWLSFTANIAEQIDFLGPLFHIW